MADDELIARLEDAYDEPVPEPTADRVAAIRAAATAQRERAVATSPTPPSSAAPTSRRAVVIGVAAAVAGVATGAAVTAFATNDDDDEPVAGPPTEPISWADGAGAVGGATLAGRLINHTWGVELLLDADKLPVGEPYRVSYVTTEAGQVEAGGFLGAELPIHCRCNAALLRADLAAIEIVDAAGAVVARADLV